MVAPRKQPLALKLLFGTVLGGVGIVVMVVLCAPWITVQGVPLTIVFKFLADQPARAAFFAKDNQALHDRLNDLDIEEDIKAYYRPQFPDEQQLDQHIHQIFYEVSGYVGRAYVVNAQDVLVPRNYKFEQWSLLAKRAGVILGSRYAADGSGLVTTPEGTVVRYSTIAPIYSRKFLRQLIRSQKKNDPQPPPQAP